ncbi:MAG: hypothetical protein V4672_13295 [Verrucomicrobiota bacterium]
MTTRASISRSDSDQSLTHEGKTLVVHRTELSKSDFSNYTLIAEVSGDNSLIDELFRDPTLLRGKQLECAFDGSHVTAKLEILTHQEFSSPDLRPILHFSCSSIDAADGEGDIYEFLLPYTNFGQGDQFTQISYDTGFAQRLDKIHFQIGGVEWTLRHLYEIDSVYYTAEAAFQILKSKGCKKFDMLESGHAALHVKTSDISQDEAEKTATDICWLLQLAFAQYVGWADLRIRTGLESKFLCRRAFSLPDEPSKIKPLRNLGDGVVKSYIENAYKVYQKDPQWWAETINWYSLSVENMAVESSSMSYCMLFDRISNHILGDAPVPKQIGQDLADGLADSVKRVLLTKQLDDLLKSFASSWSEERTIKLIEQIETWNNELSYPNKTATAFRLVGLKPPPKKLLQHRHRLMHDGRLKLQNEKALEFFFDCHQYALVLMLASLGYKGKFFCFGRGQSEMESFHSAQSDLDSLPLQG